MTRTRRVIEYIICIVILIFFSICFYFGLYGVIKWLVVENTEIINSSINNSIMLNGEEWEIVG